MYGGSSRLVGSDADNEVEMTLFEFLFFLRPYFWPKYVPERIRAMTCFLALGASKACNVIAPIFLGEAVDLLSEGVFPLNSLIAFAALRLGVPVLAELQRFMYLKVIEVAFTETAEITFRHVQHLSFTFHIGKQAGALQRAMERGLSAGGNVVNFLFLRLVPTIIELVVLCVITAIRVGSPLAAAVLFVGFFFYVVLTLGINEWRRQIRKKVVRKDNNAWRIAADALTNFEVVKSFGREEYETERFTSAVRDFQVSTRQMQGSLSVINVSQAVAMQATLLGVLLLGARDVVMGNISVGDFVVLQVYVMQVFIPLSFLGTIYSVLLNAYTDIGALLALLRKESDVKDLPDAPTLALPDRPMPDAVVVEEAAASRDGTSGIGVPIEFDNVSFAYPVRRGKKAAKDKDAAQTLEEDKDEPAGPRYVLQNVSFKVEANTTTAIVGATGSGKTTLSRLVFRYFDPQEGRILVNDQDIRNVQQISLRQAVGLVPQDTSLHNDSLESNIRYGRLEASDDNVHQAASAAELHDFIMSLDKNYATIVGERGLKLSGGERQRVAIARAILKDPPVLILDEATAALDSITEARVQAAIDRASGGRTVLVIAHRLSTIRRADQIVVLEKGRIVEKGSFNDLMEIPDGHFRNYWETQQRREEEEQQRDPNEDEAKQDEEAKKE